MQLHDNFTRSEKATRPKFVTPAHTCFDKTFDIVLLGDTRLGSPRVPLGTEGCWFSMPSRGVNRGAPCARHPYEDTAAPDRQHFLRRDCFGCYGSCVVRERVPSTSAPADASDLGLKAVAGQFRHFPKHAFLQRHDPRD